MKKIRLLHIVQCAGGVDCYLRMLLAHMDRRRYVQILLCSKSYSENDYRELVDEFIQVDLCNSLSFRKDVKAVSRIRKLIRQCRPDVIYCHSSKAGGIGRIANIGTGIPLVYNPHGWAFNMKVGRLKRQAYLWMERLLSPLTTRYVAISNYEKWSAIQHRVGRRDKIQVIFNGIDMEAVARDVQSSTVTRNSLNIPEEAYLIGMVGRISRQKAPDVFVRVAALLKDVLPEAYFMMVGDGDQRTGIERLIRENGLEERVIITGWVENPIAYACLFDQAVLLSRWEGFGLVLAEYMKLGKPIVATAVDAIPDLIVDHENGLLVRPDRPQEAARAVMDIHDNNELKEHLVKKGKERVNVLFDMERVALQHEYMLIKITSGGVKCRQISIILAAADRERRTAA